MELVILQYAVQDRKINSCLTLHLMFWMSISNLFSATKIHDGALFSDHSERILPNWDIKYKENVFRKWISVSQNAVKPTHYHEDFLIIQCELGAAILLLVSATYFCTYRYMTDTAKNQHLASKRCSYAGYFE